MAGPRRGKRDKSDGKGARILIVEARFYDDIADALLAGAIKALKEARRRVRPHQRAGLAGNPDRDRDRARCRARGGAAL